MATVNDFFATVRVDWLDIGDIASTRRAVFEVTPEGGVLELPRGERGPKGDKGDTANPVRMGSMVNTAAELPTGLTAADANLCVPVYDDRSLRVWNGYGWTTYPNWFGVKGDPGPARNVLVGTVDSGAEASVSVSPASTDTTAILDFVLPHGPAGPPGERGDVGPAASIADATDVDSSVPAVAGDVLRFNGEAWAPGRALAPVGPFTLAASQFGVANVTASSFSSTPTVLIGSLSVPALPFAWRPMVSGAVEVETSNGVFVDIEVRLGSASGPMVGVANGKSGQKLADFSHIYPYFESAVTPGNNVAVVNAGVSTNLVVLARRSIGSFGSWKTTRNRAQLVATAMPVVTVA